MDQSKRMEAVEKLRILDTLPEQAYEDIVLLASQVIRCPMAVISLVDRDRLWFKAKVGIPTTQLSRVGSFCDAAIRDKQMLVVSDALQDTRFNHNELVEAGIRFYAAVPLVLKNGEAVGTLSVLDSEPRILTQTETDLLQVLTRQVIGELERRLSLFQLEESNRAIEAVENKYRNLVQLSPAGIFQTDAKGKFVFVSKRWQKVAGLTMEEAIDTGWENAVHPEDKDKIFKEWMTADAEHRPFKCEYRLRTPDGKITWVNAESDQLRDENGVITGYLGALQDITNLKRSEEELRGAQSELENRVQERTADLRSLTESIPQLGPDGEVKKWFGTCTDIHAHKNAVEKAALAEQKLSQFLTSIPMILWATDKNGIVTLSEGKGLASLGLKPGETVGWDMLNGPEVAAESVQLIKRALSGENFDAVTHFGDRIVETQYAPLLDQSGEPSGMVAISNDITERTKLESALRLSEQRAHDSAKKLEAVLQNAPIALTEINREGIFTYSDGKYLSKLGIRPGELVGQSCFERHKSDLEQLKIIQRSFAGETVTAEFQNGSSWVQSTVTPFADKNGTVTSILALAVDITDRMKAESTIRTSESKFRKVSESKMFGMLFWDQNGAISDTNDAFLNMVGYTRDELNAGLLSWKDLTPSEYSELDTKAVAETIANGHCEPYEKEFIRKDGSRIAIIISGATIHGEVNTSGIALIVDVSAKKKAEKEKTESILNERAAIHASKTKSQFLANMSHEIRTPINGVVGMLSLLTDTPLQAEQREYVDSARASAESLLTVINDILDFSKIEAGKLEFENSDFDLFKVLNNIECAFLYQTQLKGLKLIFDCPQTISRYYNGDSGRLRQILNNLLSNAIKFTSKGHVNLSVRQDPKSRELRFEVKDTGMGIPAHALERMFRAFSQVDSSTARRFGGTGLGLSIAKHLVEKMHGAIGVETRENVGSTFWFTVQLSSAEKLVEELPEAAGTFAKHSSRPLRVLVAEDNAINQKIALKYLEKMGLRADAVANGFEVIDALRSVPYDLVLMDCQMPEMDGLEATRVIRASESLEQRNIPIIAMTANAIKGDREQCIESGMNDYVSKPVAQAELFAMLNKWLTKSPANPAPLTLDQAVIEELRQLDGPGDGSLVLELINLYLASVPSAVIKMKKALVQLNFPLISSEAHQLKSSSGNLGVMRMALITSRLEAAALANDRLMVESLLKKVDKAFQEAESELRLLLRKWGLEAA